MYFLVIMYSWLPDFVEFIHGMVILGILGCITLPCLICFNDFMVESMTCLFCSGNCGFFGMIDSVVSVAFAELSSHIAHSVVSFTIGFFGILV